VVQRKTQKQLILSLDCPHNLCLFPVFHSVKAPLFIFD
jgi:hypothetical protein